MKDIDLTKCNNCRIKVRACYYDGEEYAATGRISIHQEGLVIIECDDHQGGIELFCDGKISDEIVDFEIVPRDPETYKDWQVGDLIGCLDEEGDMDIMADHLCRVIFRSGELVAIAENYSAEEADINGCYTCSQLFREGWRLVLTDIEQKIIEEKKKYEPQDGDVCFVKTAAGNCFIFIKRNGGDEDEIYKYASIDTNSRFLYPAKVKCVCRKEDIRELRPATEDEKQQLFDAMAKEGKRWNAEKKVVEDIPKPYEFKKGEPVLVRNGSFEKWCIAAYCKPEGTTNRVFVGEAEAFFVEVIPYNERTMHLLGTSEDYKEDL